MFHLLHYTICYSIQAESSGQLHYLIKNINDVYFIAFSFTSHPLNLDYLKKAVPGWAAPPLLCLQGGVLMVHDEGRGVYQCLCMCSYAMTRAWVCVCGWMCFSECMCVGSCFNPLERRNAVRYSGIDDKVKTEIWQTVCGIGINT